MTELHVDDRPVPVALYCDHRRRELAAAITVVVRGCLALKTRGYSDPVVQVDVPDLPGEPGVHETPASVSVEPLGFREDGPKGVVAAKLVAEEVLERARVAPELGVDPSGQDLHEVLHCISVDGTEAHDICQVANAAGSP